MKVIERIGYDEALRLLTGWSADVGLELTVDELDGPGRRVIHLQAPTYPRPDGSKHMCRYVVVHYAEQERAIMASRGWGVSEEIDPREIGRWHLEARNIDADPTGEKAQRRAEVSATLGGMGLALVEQLSPREQRLIEAFRRIVPQDFSSVTVADLLKED